MQPFSYHDKPCRPFRARSGVSRRHRIAEEMEIPMKTVYFAGGCFWGVQKYFDQFGGVESTAVGYANGNTENPSYEQLKDTGHAETVKITYDENKISLSELLERYFRIIDPLSVNKQGNDIGTQYRTGIYFDDPAMLPEIDAFVKKVARKIGNPLAVEVRPLKAFYPAEEYHQKYLEKNPGGYCHIDRKFFRK